MNNWIDLTNFAIAVCGFIVTVLGLSLIIISPYISGFHKKYFKIFFTFLILYTASDLISQLSLCLFGENYSVLSKLAVLGESFFSSICLPLLTVYILYSAGGSPKKNLLPLISWLIWSIYFAILIITQFTKCIYYITDDNIYHRGKLYPLLLVPLVVLSLYNYAVLFFKRKYISKKHLIAFIIYLTLPSVCMLVQMFLYGLLLTVIGTSIASIFMFLFILSDQIEHYIMQKEENARQRASINVLEMRPHFINNTLTSIYYLCEQNPEKAQALILNFNTYLRKNFTAIVKENAIPFKEELEHTKAYLAVESVRFEDKLFVEYDTPHTHFRIPPLTLQPIVENSVKHGIDPELEPLHILIRTRETESGSIIEVCDNGPGFTDTDKDEPHIALANIKERLKLMCNGELIIKSNENDGTSVIIRI